MKKISKSDFLGNVQGILEDMKSQVDAYASEVFEKANADIEAEIASCTFESIVNNNGINLRESIKNIAASEASSNNKLMETIDQYAGALNNGLYEERLYESFIQNITKFDYLVSVDKEIKRINEAVAERASSVFITKVLEEMTQTPSYYIIPLIEEDACRFVKNPTDINRVQLRSALCAFASDPYCNLMLNSLETISDGYGKTLAEKAMSINDRIKFVREDANVSEIYSPVQYIKENESIFNANGQFYVKKNNTLAKLSEEYLGLLSDNFISLCQLINDPRVTIFEDHILLLGSDKVASIYENYIDINGNREEPASLRNMDEMSIKYDFDNNFFITASRLHENFNNIAVIDFGKHIALNKDSGVNVDMFRLGNNIYINTVNENFLKSTFYHNVNPIQCGNIINKHMGINVASLFEDLIPSQDKILLKLNETKEEYEKSIAEYEEVIKNAEETKAACTSKSDEEKCDEVIKSAQAELDKTKAEYKEWQENANEMTEAPKEETEEKPEDNTEEEKSNEPIPADEVDQVKDELSQPLENTENFDEENNTSENDPILSDEEFDSYLENNPETSTEESPVEGPIDEPDVEDVPAEETPIEGSNEEPVEDNGFTEINPESTEEEVPTEEVPAEENPEEGYDEENDEYNFTEAPADLNKDEYVNGSENEVAGYKIANILFDQNVKTGEIFRTGNVVVITPMIDKMGKMYNNSFNYNFYIDEATHNPVVDTEGVPVALYYAIVDAIKADPNFAKADSEGVSDENTKEIQTWFDSKDIEDKSNDMQNNDDKFFNVIEDEDNNTLTISPKETVSEEPVEAPVSEEPVNNEVTDKDEDAILSDIFANYGSEEAPAEEITPTQVQDNTEAPVIPAEKEEAAVDPVLTYKEGETDIELPAPSADGTEIPEISKEEAEMPTILDDEMNSEETPEDSIDFDLENETEEKPEEETNESTKYERVYTLNEAHNALLKLKRGNK